MEKEMNNDPGCTCHGIGWMPACTEFCKRPHPGCKICKGQGFYGYTVPGSDTVTEYDVDDQPCPDCNPDGGQGSAP